LFCRWPGLENVLSIAKGAALAKTGDAGKTIQL
jgi:hypothetical protein